MTKPDRWSRCGCVMRYVETCSLTTCNAFALALACGNGRPANAPVSKVITGGSASVSEEDEDTLESSSECEIGAVVGEGDSISWTVLFPFPLSWPLRPFDWERA
jgi:hypothetical protein